MPRIGTSKSESRSFFFFYIDDIRIQCTGSSKYFTRCFKTTSFATSTSPISLPIPSPVLTSLKWKSTKKLHRHQTVVRTPVFFRNTLPGAHHKFSSQITTIIPKLYWHIFTIFDHNSSLFNLLCLTNNVLDSQSLGTQIPSHVTSGTFKGLDEGCCCGWRVVLVKSSSLDGQRGKREGECWRMREQRQGRGQVWQWRMSDSRDLPYLAHQPC